MYVKVQRTSQDHIIFTIQYTSSSVDMIPGDILHNLQARNEWREAKFRTVKGVVTRGYSFRRTAKVVGLAASTIYYR